jgi:hypothetical protein
MEMESASKWICHTLRGIKNCELAKLQACLNFLQAEHASDEKLLHVLACMERVKTCIKLAKMDAKKDILPLVMDALSVHGCDKVSDLPVHCIHELNVALLSCIPA